VQIGRQGDAGGLEDPADLAGDRGAGGDALLDGRLREAVEGRAQVAPSAKSGRGELIKTV
jgi:hypothetical protein